MFDEHKIMDSTLGLCQENALFISLTTMTMLVSTNLSQVAKNIVKPWAVALSAAIIISSN